MHNEPIIGPSPKQLQQLVDQINLLSADVYWKLELQPILDHQLKIRINKESIDAETRGYVSRFFDYAEQNYKQVKEGCYYGLLVDWILNSPQDFGGRQQRFNYATKVCQMIFIKYSIDFRQDFNSLIHMTYQYINQPERFAALVRCMLDAGIDSRDLLNSQVLQTFIAHHAETLSQELNPVTLVYNVLGTCCSNPNVLRFVRLASSIFFKQDDNCDVHYSLTGAPLLECDAAIYPIGAQWLTHFEPSDQCIHDYYQCFGLNWIFPALLSIPGHHAVDVFLQQIPLDNLCGIVSHIVHESLHMALEKSKLILGRLSFKVRYNQYIAEKLCDHIQLLFLFTQDPRFKLPGYDPLYLENAIYSILEHPTPHATSQFYYILKLFQGIGESASWDDDVWYRINIALINRVFSEAHPEVDFASLNSMILFSGLRHFSPMHNLLFQHVLFEKIQTFSSYESLESFLQRHPEKFNLLILIWSGTHEIANQLDKNKLKSFWLLANGAFEARSLESSQRVIAAALKEMSELKKDRLNILLTSLLHAHQPNIANELTSYLFSKESLSETIQNHPQFLKEIINTNNLSLLGKVLQHGLPEEAIENTLLHLLQGTNTLPALGVFFEYSPPLSKKAKLSLLLYVIRNSKLDIIHEWTKYNTAHAYDNALLSEAFQHLMQSRSYQSIGFFKEIPLTLPQALIQEHFHTIACSENVLTLKNYHMIFKDLVSESSFTQLVLDSIQAEHWENSAYLYEQIRETHSEKARLGCFSDALAIAYPNIQKLNNISRYENPNLPSAKQAILTILYRSISDDEPMIFSSFHVLVRETYTNKEITKLYTTAKRCGCDAITQQIMDDCCEEEIVCSTSGNLSF